MLPLWSAIPPRVGGTGLTLREDKFSLGYIGTAAVLVLPLWSAIPPRVGGTGLTLRGDHKGGAGGYSFSLDGHPPLLPPAPRCSLGTVTSTVWAAVRPDNQRSGPSRAREARMHGPRDPPLGQAETRPGMGKQEPCGLPLGSSNPPNDRPFAHRDEGPAAEPRRDGEPHEAHAAVSGIPPFARGSPMPPQERGNGGPESPTEILFLWGGGGACVGRCTACIQSRPWGRWLQGSVSLSRRCCQEDTGPGAGGGGAKWSLCPAHGPAPCLSGQCESWGTFWGTCARVRGRILCAVPCSFGQSPAPFVVSTEPQAQPCL